MNSFLRSGKFHRTSDAIQPLAVAGRAEFPIGGKIIGIEGAQRIGDFVGSFLILVGIQHPVVDASVTAAGWTPAFG